MLKQQRILKQQRNRKAKADKKRKAYFSKNAPEVPKKWKPKPQGLPPHLVSKSAADPGSDLVWAVMVLMTAARIADSASDFDLGGDSFDLGGRIQAGKSVLNPYDAVC